MKITTRRAITLSITVFYLFIYLFFATTISMFFANKPFWVQILFFGAAGVAWVLPLYPLYVWMRPKADELEEYNRLRQKNRK